jgi:hypothetical protein
MMKMDFDARYFGVLLVAVACAMPVAVSAKDISSVRQTVGERQENRQDAFCERFSERAAQAATAADTIQASIDKRQDGREARLNESRAKRNEALDDARSEADQRRSEMYQNLENAAVTDEQKAAVKRFKETVEAAIQTRRSTVDASIASFRSDVDGITSRRNALAAVSAFQSAVQTASASAKNACANGTDALTVRATFRSAIQAARQGLVSERNKTTEAGTQMDAAIAKRRAAIVSAVEAFRYQLDQARIELQAAFNETEREDL